MVFGRRWGKIFPLDFKGRNSYFTGMNKTVLSEKGQVTIPKSVRDALGLKPGQALDFTVDQGEIRVRKLNPVDPAEAVFGMLKDDRSSDEILAQLRGPADP